MKLSRLIPGAAALLALCSSGCRVQEDFSRVADEVQPLASEAVRIRRAESLRKIWETLPVRAIHVDYHDLSPYDKMKPERFVGRLQKLGCNRLVITIRPDTDLHWKPLHDIAEAAGKAGIGLCIKLEQKDYSQTYRGNRLIRDFVSRRVTLEEKCAEVERFNRSLSDDAKLSGIVLAAQPDYFSESNRKDRPKTLLFTWTPDRYGIGLGNDAIVQYTMRSFRECVLAGSGKIPYLFAVPDYLHDAARQKKLSQGALDDFLRIGTSSSKEIFLDLEVRVVNGKLDFSGAEQELGDGSGKVIVSFDISPHQAVSDGNLPRRSWKNMLSTARFCIRKWRGKPGFHGVMIGSWPVLQAMLGEL